MSARFLVGLPPELETRVHKALREGADAAERLDWTRAFALYERAYGEMLRAQQPGTRFHKGEALHNMGLAKLFLADPQLAYQYTLLAFLEDVQSKRDEQVPGYPELDLPAARNLVYVFAVPGPVLVNLVGRIEGLIRSGVCYPDPIELAWHESLTIPTELPDLETGHRAEAALQAGVRVRLRQAGIEARSVDTAGLRLDLAVETVAGLIVLEVIGFIGPDSLSRVTSAMRQMRHIAAATGAFRVVGVVDDRWKDVVSVLPDIVSESEAADFVLDLVRLAEQHPLTEQHAVIPAQTRRPTIFAAMPFAGAFEDTFFVAIRGAAKAVGATAIRVDHYPEAGDVVDRIKREISASALVVVDVSGARASVMHEYGFAEAAGRSVIAITSTGLSALPFNVRNNETLEYQPGRTAALRRELTRRIRTEFRRLGVLPNPGSRGRKASVGGPPA